MHESVLGLGKSLTWVESGGCIRVIVNTTDSSLFAREALSFLISKKRVIDSPKSYCAFGGDEDQDHGMKSAAAPSATSKTIPALRNRRPEDHGV